MVIRFVEWGGIGGRRALLPQADQTEALLAAFHDLTRLLQGHGVPTRRVVDTRDDVSLAQPLPRRVELVARLGGQLLDEQLAAEDYAKI